MTPILLLRPGPEELENEIMLAQELNASGWPPADHIPVLEHAARFKRKRSRNQNAG
jgi:hypothetical protein